MSREITEKYARIPLSQLTALQDENDVVKIYRNRWWAVTDNDEALIYRGYSPQCNKEKAIVETMMPDGCKAVFIPLAFLEFDVSESSYFV